MEQELLHRVKPSPSPSLGPNQLGCTAAGGFPQGSTIVKIYYRKDLFLSFFLGWKIPNLRQCTQIIDRYTTQMSDRYTTQVVRPDSVTSEGQITSFDGLVRTPLMQPRICMSNRACPESLVHTVLENATKSGIRFILGSLHRLWSKRCNFCSVGHLRWTRVFMRWKVLKTLHNWYQFSGQAQMAKLVHYTTEYPPFTVLRPQHKYIHYPGTQTHTFTHTRIM